MKNTLGSQIIEPCFYTCDDIIIDVNKEFTDFTGFTIDELLGKSLIEIEALLKINLQKLSNSINDNHSVYIFTKSLNSREVTISLLNDTFANEQAYTFVEKPNSRLDDKFIFMEQLFIDNTMGYAVYSVPDLILLKSNEKYLNLLDSPLNSEGNIIGLPVSEIVEGFYGSETEAIWDSILETKKNSYIKNISFKGAITYWTFTQTAILQNGKIEYIFETACEVTESVPKNHSLLRKNEIIEKQKEQLEQKNTQLMCIIENLSEGVVLADNTGKFIMANSEAKRLVCQSDNVTFLGDSFKSSKLFDMKGNEIPFENLPGFRALRGEEVRNLKAHIKHPTKEYFLEISSIPIYNTLGDITMVISCFHDITDTIEKSRKIEEQKNQLEAIIENISDGISIFDNNGKYISFNKSERKMFFPYYEYSAQTSERYYVYIDKTSDNYNEARLYDINGDEIALENTPISRVMRGEKFKNMRMEVRFPHKTLQIDVSGTPIYDSEGKFTIGVLCTQNMTDYFKREQTIRNQYKFLNKIIDTFDLPVVRISCPDLKVVDINKKAFSIIKFLNPDILSVSKLTQNKLEDLFKIYEQLETSKCYLYINEVIREKETKYLNKMEILLNGNQTYWNVIFEPMFEVNGEIQEILIILIDVTAEIKSNIIMEKALKLQGEFLVNISHELKTPLNVIFATAQLFDMYCKNGSLDDKKNSIVKYIHSIKQNSYRLSKLINNIVDLSKIEAGFYKLNLSNNDIV
ncbi:MAG: PAS domain-containing protein, partial [Clostridium sp.]